MKGSRRSTRAPLLVELVQEGHRVEVQLNVALLAGSLELADLGSKGHFSQRQQDITEQCTHDSTISGSLCERVHTGRFSES